MQFVNRDKFEVLEESEIDYHESWVRIAQEQESAFSMCPRGGGLTHVSCPTIGPISLHARTCRSMGKSPTKLVKMTEAVSRMPSR